MNQNSSFEMNDLERQYSCLQTIVNMLIKRRWLDKDSDEIKKLDKYKEVLLIDPVDIICDNKKVTVKFYNVKLTTLKNDKEIDKFLSTKIDYHKILVINDISSKLEKLIMDSKNFEVFKMMEIIKDISKHDLVPEQVLLTEEQAKEFMEAYKLKKKDMGRVYIDDPMARYLYAQKDDIIQIIRPSIGAGYSTYYRLVVPGSIYT